MKKLNKIIGEAVLISPLFALSFLFDLWSECLLMIVALFFYKSLYPQQYHAWDDEHAEYVEKVAKVKYALDMAKK